MSLRVDTDTRDVNSPEDNLNIAVGFNPAVGDGGVRGTEVIVPDDANAEIRAAAAAFNQSVVEFMASKGISGYPNLGVKTLTESGGRGVQNTIHPEPFFNDDLEATQAVRDNLPEFAANYLDSFGDLDALLIPSHGVNDRGSTSSVFIDETTFGELIVILILDALEPPAPPPVVTPPQTGGRAPYRGGRNNNRRPPNGGGGVGGLDGLFSGINSLFGGSGGVFGGGSGFNGLGGGGGSQSRPAGGGAGGPVQDSNSYYYGAPSDIRTIDEQTGERAERQALAAGGEYLNILPGVDMRVDQRLVDITNEAARQVGIPLTIVDGFRETAGRGASNSQHLYGRAFDISGQGLNNQDRLDLSEAASTLGITGIGFYSGGSLHWDIRPGARTVWGDDWTRATVPAYAREFASQHEAGAFFDSGALDSSLGGDELGSAVGDVTDASPELGALSSVYESNGDPTAYGEDRTGGPSYGEYQIATRTGTMGNYLDFLKTENPSLYNELQAAGGESAARAGSSQFRTAWERTMSNPANAATQHTFIASTHYDPAVRRIASNTGFNVSSRSTVVQDVVWSTAVQHGSTGASNIVGRVLSRTGPNPSDEAFIRGVYAERGASNGTRYFGSSTSSVRNSVVNRFRREESDALARLRAGGN
jgi:hypothetical protein